MSELTDRAMSDLYKETMKRFSDGIIEERKKFEKKLIDAGYSPDAVVIAERIWYDEQTHSLKYECIPLSKGVDLTNVKKS